jgi:hypothetical protein
MFILFSYPARASSFLQKTTNVKHVTCIIMKQNKRSSKILEYSTPKNLKKQSCHDHDNTVIIGSLQNQYKYVKV